MPKGPKPIDPAIRFWPKVDRGEPDACWLWRTAKTPNTHITFQLGRRVGGLIGAHRFSWILTHGPIPDGLFVLHRCDVPACVNPSHLFLGTQQDNLKDMREKRRDRPWANHTKPARGTEHWNTKLTPDDVREIRALVAGGMTQRSAGQRFGVVQATVRTIVIRQTWAHVA